MSDLEPARAHNGGYSTDAVDPEAVRELARRLVRPLRERAKALGYALTEHGSRQRDIDLVAVPWGERACPPEIIGVRHGSSYCTGQRSAD